jgi:hypothetical protein
MSLVKPIAMAMDWQTPGDDVQGDDEEREDDMQDDDDDDAEKGTTRHNELVLLQILE